MYIEKKITQTGKAHEPARKHRVFPIGIQKYIFQKQAITCIAEQPPEPHKRHSYASASKSPVGIKRCARLGRFAPGKSAVLRPYTEVQVKLECLLTGGDKVFPSAGEIQIQQKDGDAAGPMGKADTCFLHASPVASPFATLAAPQQPVTGFVGLAQIEFITSLQEKTQIGHAPARQSVKNVHTLIEQTVVSGAAKDFFRFLTHAHLKKSPCDS